jgi:hypothetical protein
MYTTISTDSSPTLDTTFSAGTNLDLVPGVAGRLTREAVDRAFDQLVEQTDQDQDHLDTPDTPVTLRTPQARCADGHGTLTHLFFSDDVLDIARAKAICRSASSPRAASTVPSTVRSRGACGAAS